MRRFFYSAHYSFTLIFKNNINLDKDRKKAFLVGLSTRVNKDKYNDGIYLVNIEGEVIGLRRNKKWRNKKKVCNK